MPQSVRTMKTAGTSTPTRGWELELRARQLAGTAILDNAHLDLLRRLEEHNPFAHWALLRHLQSYDVLNLKHRLRRIMHAYQGPIWEVDVLAPILDQLPVWMVRELTDVDDPHHATRWIA
ncbi:hypothetical protein [Deinococcus maricopensis]|uniref:Uncharacterized protein n=1 Tax=Deinococcus maricopensis (strain DSM 21211 / LMG 22137 / NRRL B-23946 / LB-34) TaxID=709986 RepID=E8U624_DEIML|nr:hypothetical protein [Deinococcus maricopensis]ADV66513.1 hypothetical protein Deima_0858 [Deinococcus maricopensis DSM 21211]